MGVDALPRFDDLPTLQGLGLRHAWGIWGPGDQLGTVNLLTPQRVSRAASLIRDGQVVNLVVPLTAIDPPLYGREPVRHTVFATGRNNWDDRLDNLYLQSSSQWDGFRHVRCREFGFWGGVTEDPVAGGGQLGVEHWVEHGMVGRGVLLDVAAHLGSRGEYDPLAGRSITPEDLAETARGQGVSLEAGDILCVRTGWMGAFRPRDQEGRTAIIESRQFAGLAAGEEMARWLWDQHFAAVACDNPAVEVSPGDPAIGSLHRRLIPLLGFMLGELFDFEALARACRADGRWEFCFVSVPLYLPGGVGSPANAIAIR